MADDNRPGPVTPVSGPVVHGPGGQAYYRDPTQLTSDAVAAAVDVSRRELAALRQVLETRMDGIDRDRGRLWAAVNSWPGTLEERLEYRHREFEGDLAAGTEVLKQRLDSMDKAIALAADELNTARADLPVKSERERVRRNEASRAVHAAEREFVMAQIALVQAVMTEKFAAVDGRFGESKIAVDAAFAAAKEAVTEQNKSNSAAIAKSEAATKEQLESLRREGGTDRQAMTDKIDDARTRLTTVESRTAGLSEGTGQARSERTEERAKRETQHNQIMLVLFALALVVSIISVVISVAFIHH